MSYSRRSSNLSKFSLQIFDDPETQDRLKDSGEQIPISTEIWKNLSIPQRETNPSCYTYDVNWTDLYSKYNDSITSITSNTSYSSAVNESKIRKCTKLQFDRSFWKRTIVQVKFTFLARKFKVLN